MYPVNFIVDYAVIQFSDSFNFSIDNKTSGGMAVSHKNDILSASFNIEKMSSIKIIKQIILIIN